MLLQLDNHLIYRILPLSRLCIKRPICEYEIRIESLFDFGGSRLQVFGVTYHLLPEVALQVLLFSHKHGLSVEMAALQALSAPVLLPHD